MNENKLYEVGLDGSDGISSPSNLWRRLGESKLEKVAGEGTPKTNKQSLEVYKTPNNDAIIFSIFWEKAYVSVISQSPEQALLYLKDNIKGINLKPVSGTPPEFVCLP